MHTDLQENTQIKPSKQEIYVTKLIVTKLMMARRSTCLPPFPSKSLTTSWRGKFSHLVLIKLIGDLVFALLHFNTTALQLQKIICLNSEKYANIWCNIQHSPDAVAGITLTIAANLSNRKALTLSITTEPQWQLKFMMLIF